MTWWQTVLCAIGGFVVVCWALFCALVAVAMVAEHRNEKRRVVAMAERYAREAAE